MSGKIWHRRKNMAKVLGETCEDIIIKTVQISRKQAGGPEESGEWQTYAVVMGESVDADGNSIVGHDIHEKIDIGSPGLDPWTPSTVDNDLKAAATAVKQLFKDIAKDKADLNL
jgi:hypothetical protein